MQKIQKESVHMNELVENITDGINDSNENVSNVSATMQELSASMEEEVAATLSQITEGAQEILNASKDMEVKAQNGTDLSEKSRIKTLVVHAHILVVARCGVGQPAFYAAAFFRPFAQLGKAHESYYFFLRLFRTIFQTGKFRRNRL